MLTTTRPLPATPYTGRIRTPRPLPLAPQPPTALPPIPTPSGSPKPILKRRPHTHRLQSPPSADLPPVTEEEESEGADEEHSFIPKLMKRPRPAPLIPTRKYAPSSLPLVVEIPESAGSFDRPMKTDEYEAFSLSPSMLLERRHSETTLDFPVPPSHAISIPTSSSPVAPADNSPTPSDLSLASISSASSSPYPITPHSSEVDERDVQPNLEKLDVDAVNWDDVYSPRRPYRSSSVVSLRSFNMTEFDAQVADIYTLLHPRREADVSTMTTFREETPVASGSTPISRSSPRLVLSVLDTTHGGSFDVPLMLGSFLSPPSSPATSEPPLADNDSDCEGIPISWSDSESDDFGSALSSSDDDTSDNEERPSCCLDPEFRAMRGRLRPDESSRSPSLPALPMLEPLEMGPDTSAVYSTDSFVDWTDRQVASRESLMPLNAPRASYAPPSAHSPQSPSPSQSRADSSSPVLRSRFSTSTLGSLPPQPASSTQAFFARLTSRVKPSSPIKAQPAHTSRPSPRRRHVIPASPAPSAFSFSTHSTSSRSSLDSADSSSLFSEDSSSSSGLRRPPIPIELFLRG